MVAVGRARASSFAATLTFDTAVPALQENLDALFSRWRELYSSGGCDLTTLQSHIGLPDELLTGGR